MLDVEGLGDQGVPLEEEGVASRVLDTGEAVHHASALVRGVE
jgi:hypothetical protein